MLTFLSYFAVFVVALVIMIFTDEDRNHVSLIEWSLYGVMLYAAFAMLRKLVEFARQHGEY